MKQIKQYKVHPHKMEIFKIDNFNMAYLYEYDQQVNSVKIEIFLFEKERQKIKGHFSTQQIMNREEVIEKIQEMISHKQDTQNYGYFIHSTETMLSGKYPYPKGIEFIKSNIKAEN